MSTLLGLIFLGVPILLAWALFLAWPAVEDWLERLA